MALSRSALFLLAGALIALMVIVGLSLQRETTVRAPAAPAASTALSSAMTTTATAPAAPATAGTATVEQSGPAPLTAEEETFAEAIWPLHQEVVEASAGRLASAGLAFATDDHDAHRLEAKLIPLRQVFHETREKMASIPAPSSLEPVRDRYLALLALYEQSANEMLEVVRDGDEGHLIDAQFKSEHAAEELVKVGDILWPGEHKPN